MAFKRIIVLKLVRVFVLVLGCVSRQSPQARYVNMLVLLRLKALSLVEQTCFLMEQKLSYEFNKKMNFLLAAGHFKPRPTRS